MAFDCLRVCYQRLFPFIYLFFFLLDTRIRSRGIRGGSAFTPWVSVRVACKGSQLWRDVGSAVGVQKVRMEKRLKEPAASALRAAAACVRARVCVCVHACHTSVQYACEEIGCWEHFKVLQAVCARKWKYQPIFALF